MSRFRYHIPRDVLVKLGLAMVTGQTLSLAEAALRLEAVLPTGSGVEGLAHVPRQGPFALAPNHWQRPGLWIGWPSMMLAAALTRIRPDDPPVHFVVTASNRVQIGGLRFRNPLTIWAFREVARVYGLVTMPAEEDNTTGRALAIRRTLRLALPAPRGVGAPVCIYPEGTGGRAGTLGSALPGVGELLWRLAHAGVLILPVGIWESDGGGLRAAIGPPVSLAPAHVTERDQWARERVMAAIADCLPPLYRGRYG